MKLKNVFKDNIIWTISNLLSLLRIPLGIILYLLITNQNTTGAIAIAFLGIISDYADGYIARKRNEVSELGKIFDPLGDKIMVALGSIALCKAYGLPAWIVVIIIARDLLIIFGSLILSSRTKTIVASELPGKITVLVISILLLTYLFEIEMGKIPFLILTVVLVAFSFLFYLKKFIILYTRKYSDK